MDAIMKRIHDTISWKRVESYEYVVTHNVQCVRSKPRTFYRIAVPVDP